ncbi:hypothetical protein ACMFMG_009658 [Clarireedia jacksonii]
MDPLSIAGLALGAYPVLSHAFNQYKQGIEHCHNWRRFRTQFEAFRRKVDAESYFFENIIRELIFEPPAPFSLKGTSEEEVLERMKDQNDRIWQSSELKRTVRLRLDDRYDWFLATIQEIREIQEELYTRLQISELNADEYTAQWWEFQWKRIKDTLSIEQRDQKIEKLHSLTESLQRTLEIRDKRLGAGGAKSFSAFPKAVEKVQQSACSLYSALMKAWRCSCVGSHTTLLRLDHCESLSRTSNAQHTSFDVVFIVPTKNTIGCDQLGDVITFQKRKDDSHIRQAVEIKVFDSQKDISQQPVQPVQAKQQLTPILSSKANTIQNVSADPQKHSFRRTLKDHLPFRSKTSLLGVPSNSPQKPNSISSLMTISPVKDTVVTLLDPVLPSPSPPSPEQNKPNDGQQQQSNATYQPKKISNICHTIQTLTAGNCPLGYLPDDKTTRHELTAGDRSNIPPTKNLISLKEVLTKSKTHFSTQRRMIVATILTSSLLELLQTQWLHTYWSKENVFFEKSDDSSQTAFCQPYIIHEFEPGTNVSPSQLSQASDIPLRIFLQCLGIVLIELCFGKTIEEMEDTALVTPVNASDSRSYHTYCLAIANGVAWDIIYGENPTFSDPISNCLHPPNLRMMSEGKHTEVLDDIFLTIVKPLHEEILHRWPQSF